LYITRPLMLSRLVTRKPPPKVACHPLFSLRLVEPTKGVKPAPTSAVLLCTSSWATVEPPKTSINTARSRAWRNLNVSRSCRCFMESPLHFTPDEKGCVGKLRAEIAMDCDVQASVEQMPDAAAIRPYAYLAAGNLSVALS